MWQIPKRRPNNVSPAMKIQDRGLGATGWRRDERGHATGCDRPDARARRRRELGLETLERCTHLVQVGILGDE